MAICKICGAESPEQAAFCTQCGAQLEDAQNQTQEAPVYTYAPVAVESKVPSILGMIFGISAVFLAFILFVCTIENLDSYYYSYPEYLIGNWFGFSLFIVPGIVVGLIMSFKARAGAGMALAGKITSFVSVGLLFISFIMALSA